MTITRTVWKICGWALAGMSLSAAAAGGAKVDEKVRQKIAEAAQAGYGWKTDEVRVDEVERLRRPGCSFYTVAHTVRPLSYQANYALLPDKVTGPGDGITAAKIVDICANGAGADWWAEIVTRFHRDVGGGIVLRDASVRPDIVRKLTAAGQEFTPPALGKDGLSLTFLVLNPETYVLYRVQARRRPAGPIHVEKDKIAL